MQTLKQTKGKLLGVDFGDKRTGIAVSDSLRTMASGRQTISVGGMEKTAEKTAEIARELGVVGVVVGVPVNMDGSFGPRAQHAQKFANILQYKLGESIHVATLAASRYLNETDTRGAKRKQVIDTLSAEIILQNALDKLKFMQ